MATLTCPNCGFQTDDRARFCQKCGATLPAASQQTVAQPVYGAAPAYAAPAAYAGVRYGGFWLRVVAAIVDSIVTGVLIAPLALVIVAPMMTGGREPDEIWLGMSLWPLSYGVKLVYFAAMESSAHQATLGKLLCGLRVTDINGQRLSFVYAAVRYIAKILSTLTLGIGYLMAGFTARKQALHDMVAGTLVVRR